MSGAVNAAITGGDIGKSAIVSRIAAAAGKLGGSYIPHLSDEIADFSVQLAGHSLIGGVTGGIAAELYGGSFGQGFCQGAWTADFGFVFNSAASRIVNKIAHAGFIKQIGSMADKSLLKTIKSLRTNIAEHEAALLDPEQALAKRHHETELMAFKAQLELAEQEAIKRGVMGLGTTSFAEDVTEVQAGQRTDSWFDWIDPFWSPRYAY
jgi:hypothetical protein